MCHLSMLKTDHCRHGLIYVVGVLTDNRRCTYHILVDITQYQLPVILQDTDTCLGPLGISPHLSYIVPAVLPGF
jgi:hypothetical protein